MEVWKKNILERVPQMQALSLSTLRLEPCSQCQHQRSRGQSLAGTGRRSAALLRGRGTVQRAQRVQRSRTCTAELEP